MGMQYVGCTIICSGNENITNILQNMEELSDSSLSDRTKEHFWVVKGLPQTAGLRAAEAVFYLQC